MDIEYRTAERRIFSGNADPDDWITYYKHQRHHGTSRNYRCGCAQFHQIEPCNIPGCPTPVPRFFCGDEECALCSACTSTRHSVHYECANCFKRGCQFHFKECVRCESRGRENKYCPWHINEDGLCLGMRIPPHIEYAIPGGYVRGCADL